MKRFSFNGHRDSLYSNSLNESQILETENGTEGSSPGRGGGGLTLTDQWGNWYSRKFMDSIREFRSLLREFLLRITELRELWRNEERV